jgi:hypothetical protein
MLVAPLPAVAAPARPRPSRRSRHQQRRVRAPATHAWLLAWLAVGVVALLLYPDLRGGPTLGLTLPFWLVAAPLIDLAWLRRRRLAASLAQRGGRPASWLR